MTDSISEGLACEKDSVSCNSLCCAHRVRDRARKVRPMDRDHCHGDAVVESRRPSATLSWGIAKARSHCLHFPEIVCNVRRCLSTRSSSAAQLRAGFWDLLTLPLFGADVGQAKTNFFRTTGINTATWLTAIQFLRSGHTIRIFHFCTPQNPQNLS